MRTNTNGVYLKVSQNLTTKSMKKSYFNVLAILFLFSTGTKAQVFSESFTNNATVNSQKVGFASTPNSILTGLTEIETSNNFRNTIHLLMVANDGNVQESFLYETVDTNFSISCLQIIKISENTIFISGNYGPSNSISFPFIMSINNSGDINWAKKIEVPSYESPDITVLSDNSILCIIRYNDGQLHQIYCKIDALGNLSSFFEIDNPFKIIKTILVKNNSFDLLFFDGNLLNINNDLSAINWQRKYENIIGIAINNTLNNDYIIATAQVAFPGYLTITRTDSQGNVLWSKYIESWLGTVQDQGTIFDVTGIHSIKEDANGNIIVAANSEGGLSGTFQITLNANGEYVSNYKTSTYHNKIMPYGNNEQLILGYTNQGESNTSNIVLQKLANSNITDCDNVMSFSMAEGNQVMPTPDSSVFTPSAALSTTDVIVQKSSTPAEINGFCNILLSVEDVLDKADIQIFPVPSSDYIEIKSDAIIKEINLYDISGKLLIKTRDSKINISSLSNSIYIIEVIGAEKTLIQKIIKN